MKLINSAVAFATLFTVFADAQSADRDLQKKPAAPVPVPVPVPAPAPAPAPGTTTTLKALGDPCQVTYNAASNKYMGVKGMECASNLVCSELNDNGEDGVIFIGKCNKEACGGKADPGGSPTAQQEISSHRVTICHRTCSETNPWVRITIDDDAWGGPDASGCGHQREHNVTQDCNKSDYSAWGPNRVDYLIKDHGTRAFVRTTNGFTTAQEKAYWFYWERACPYVRAKKGANVCCDWAKGECCGPHPDDKCPLDPLKTAPGVCGCGIPDTDTDGDGTPDCIDHCKNNKAAKKLEDLKGCKSCNDSPEVIAAACPVTTTTTTTAKETTIVVPPCPQCGCGQQDIDTDGDGVLDCFDVCPKDPKKTTSLGHCGCGVSEVDTDGDGTPDCKDLCPGDMTKLIPGTCGCGIPDKDSDTDGTVDCKDLCPNDMVKVDPGLCGCGVSDIDTDGDGVPDCDDGCSRDSSKTEEGKCGCGVSDVDTDGDGTPDCQDLCKDDPSKIAPGLCGCGKGDLDNDGTCDEKDQCQNDPNKNAPGQCGCGAGDTDSDFDGVADCKDGCSIDPNKISPGACGCGVPDTDSDNDGTPDCNDGCSTDATKTAPGICGCGKSDVDSDGDGLSDCVDQCPDDVNKIIPGTCGCGKSEMDSDGDGSKDCQDLCPSDVNKISPGLCGCGIPDTDADGDGTPDCNDSCSVDPNKTLPGTCGCGTSDVDSDGDGTPDCIDGCPMDKGKITPGQCGCGLADTDSDSDGTANCNDKCPEDPAKILPGQCGCGVVDADADADGTCDHNDLCRSDPNKTQPGLCGCGVADTDTDKDMTPDCLDGCSVDPSKTAPGACGCGTPDTDTDNDGVPDCNDSCSADPKKIEPGICGCGLPDVDSDNDGVLDCNDSCSTDPEKTEPGTCGCGTPETDTDGDGVPDCTDLCHMDIHKTVPGVCGCGTQDIDSDSDGVPDCKDLCPLDPSMSTEPDLLDSDGDGTLDCNDGCSADPDKVVPGECGCGFPDVDDNEDGIMDCKEVREDITLTSSNLIGTSKTYNKCYDMYNAGNRDPKFAGYVVAASAYCLTDCNAGAYCIKVQAAPGIQLADKEAWFKDYTSSTSSIQPIAPGIVLTYASGKVIAWEGCFEIPAGATGADIEIHANWGYSKDRKLGNTASTGRPTGAVINYDQCLLTEASALTTPVAAPVTAVAEATPVAVPAAAPVDTPVAVPAAAPVDTPVAVPAAAPVDTPVAVPAAAPVDTPVAVPAAAPVDTPVAVPAAAPVETPVETPVEAPVATESVTVTPPTGAAVDNDPSVGLPTANQVGDGESGGGYGDPHLKTWMGEVYDFHGACDLVLVTSPSFHHGAGLDVHIRTKIRDDWSFISDAAIRIGDDVLEVGTRAYYYLNDVAGVEMPSTLGGFPVSLTHFGTRRHKFEIDLGHMGVIVVKVFNEFLAVEVNNAHSDGFGDSVGLMGTFTDGSLVGRSGNVHADHNEFGLSWQVHDTDSNLFQKAEGPQYPQLCQMPAPMAMKSRRMSESVVSFEVAAKACADWTEETRESCIYDVMSTGDLDMAEAGAF